MDLVNLRKSFTSTHKTFENAIAKLDMILSLVIFLISVVAFLIAFDAGVQQYAVGVSSVSVQNKKKCAKGSVQIEVCRKKVLGFETIFTASLSNVSFLVCFAFHW